MKKLKRTLKQLLGLSLIILPISFLIVLGTDKAAFGLKTLYAIGLCFSFILIFTISFITGFGILISLGDKSEKWEELLDMC